MAHFVGLDVSVKETSVCVVDDAGKVVCERKVPTEPDDIAVLLTSVGGDYARVGIEAVNRRPKRTPYRRAKGTPFVEQRDGYDGRTVRAGCGVGRA
ncbi:hypothetical protein [Sphingomonas sp. VNH70]|uniref:hypothetical protein n=1 Tax=Sphingomonas silueang TaxID=3156617 RepID=UPI0032B58F01